MAVLSTTIMKMTTTALLTTIPAITFWIWATFFKKCARASRALQPWPIGTRGLPSECLLWSICEMEKQASNSIFQPSHWYWDRYLVLQTFLYRNAGGSICRDMENRARCQKIKQHRQTSRIAVYGDFCSEGPVVWRPWIQRKERMRIERLGMLHATEAWSAIRNVFKEERRIRKDV